MINKTDLAPLVGADLAVMERDARRMRGDGPFVFAQVTNDVGVETVVDYVLRGWKAAISTRLRRLRRRNPQLPKAKLEAGNSRLATGDWRRLQFEPPHVDSEFPHLVIEDALGGAEETRGACAAAARALERILE